MSTQTIKTKYRLKIAAEVTPSPEQQAALSELTSFAKSLDQLPESEVAYRSLRASIMRLASGGIQPYFLCHALTSIESPPLRAFIDATLAPLFARAAQQEHEARERDGNLGIRNGGKIRVALGVRQR